MESNISIGELTNSSVKLTIGDETLEVRQLQIRELWGYFESKIKEKKLKEAQEMASLMEGDEKKQFLIEVWKNLPSGQDLSDSVSNEIASSDGFFDIIYLASKDFNNTITIEELKTMCIGFKDLDDLAPLVTWILGTEAALEVDGVDGEAKAKVEVDKKGKKKRNK